jgi:hypothetical protein
MSVVDGEYKKDGRCEQLGVSSPFHIKGKREVAGYYLTSTK